MEETMKRLNHLKLFVTFCVVLCVAAAGAVPAHAVEKAAESKAAKASKVDKSGLININTAGLEKLVKLPRIGVKMAGRIIDFRKKNGKFKKIEDIMKVKGIGEKTFEGFRDKITI
jgi:competence protein ComEA